MPYKEYGINGIANEAVVIWKADSQNETLQNTILPDSCADIIIKFKDLNDTENIDFNHVSILAVGLMTKPKKTLISPDDYYLGIRIKPSFIFDFFENSIHEITNQIIPLNNINKQLSDIILSTIDNAKCLKDIRLNIQSIISDLIKAYSYENQNIKYLINQVCSFKGNINVRNLSQKSGLSERTIERHFKNSLGISPKKFSRIVRFHSAYNELKIKNCTDLAAFSLEAGYYDQSHFNREFKEFSGMTPLQVK